MNWLKSLWQSMPEKMRNYALRVLVWVVMAGLGWLIGYLTGGKVEQVPFPVYVEVAAPAIADPPTIHTTGWHAPTEDETQTALVTIKAQQAGLDPRFAAIAQAAMEAVDSDDPVFFWEAELKVLKRLLPSWDQGSVGSCVAHGWGRGCQDLLLVQIANGNNGNPEKWPGAQVNRESIYGGSRVEIGGGRIGGDGSIGAWAGQYVQKYGLLFDQQYPGFDLSGGYSISRCREWGNRGVPDALEPLAKAHPVRTIAQVNTAAECWVAIGSGYPIPICSDAGFESPLKEGFCEPRGSWAHCMLVRGRFVHPIRGKCFVIQNSWGDYLAKYQGQNAIAVVGRPDPVGLPQGCFAIEAKTLDRIVKQRDSFAISAAVGFPRKKIDWNVRANNIPARAIALANRP